MAPKRKPADDNDSESESEPIKKPRTKQTAKKSPAKRARDDESEDDVPLAKPKPKVEKPLTAKKPRIAGAPASTSKKSTSKKAPVVEEEQEQAEEEEEPEGSGRIVVHTSLEGDKYVDLGKKKRASVRVFKGAVMVDIREFYGDEDDLKPGKKGISLGIDQWKALVASVVTIDKLIDRKK